MLSYFLFIAVNLVLFFILFRNSVDRKLAFTLLLVKLIAAIAFYWVYGSYYTAGDLRFYEKVLHEVYVVFQEHGAQAYLKYLFLSEWPIDPEPAWFSRARIPMFIKIVSLPHFLALGNTAVTGFYLSTLSLLVFLAISLKMHLKKMLFPVIMTFFLVPSFLIFTSGINKETVVIPLLFWCFYLQYRLRKFGVNWFLLPLLVAVVWGIRPFLGAVFLLQFVVFLLHLNRIYLKKAWLNHKAYVIVGVLSVLSMVFYVLSLKKLHWLLIHQYEKYYKISSGTHMMEFDFNGYSWWDLLKNIPAAFYQSWIGPQWQDLNLMVMASKIECLILLTIFVLALFFDVVKKRFNILKRPELVFYVLFFACLLPIAAPDWGTFMRYRLMYLPLVSFYSFWVLRKVWRTWVLKKTTNVF